MRTITFSDLNDSFRFSHVYGLSQHWSEGSSWSTPEGGRIDHGFMLVLGDVLTIKQDGCDKEMEFSSGALLYIPRWSHYTVSFRKTPERFTDHLINFCLCDAAGEECQLFDRITLLSRETPVRVLDEIRRICDCSCNMKDPYLPIMRTFYSLLDRVRNFRDLEILSDLSKKTVMPALIYINNHIAENTHISDLAKMCLMSDATFCRYFRKTTGYSPAQYKIFLKIEKAKTLLAGSADITIAEISDALGFYDLSYFYKTFTAAVGTPPSRWREEQQPIIQHSVK